jgi:hypothetical protein
MENIKQFDEAHRSSRAVVMPLEDSGIKINSKSIVAWRKYCTDYEELKAEENTGEGEVFMRPMPSFRKYLEKENFMEKEQRRLKIGTHSGRSTLKKLHIEEEEDVAELQAPPVFEIVRIPNDVDDALEKEEIDHNDAFLEKHTPTTIKPLNNTYYANSFTGALQKHTVNLDGHKKALWNDCVVFVSNENKNSYSVNFLRKHAFPDKLYILQKLRDWKVNMNTLGKQHLAHELVITNIVGQEIKISDVPYRLDQVDKLRTIGKKKGAYLINLVGNRSI